MKVDRSKIFEVLEPRRGGVDRLRARIARDARDDRAARWTFVSIAAGVVLATTLIVILGDRPDNAGTLPSGDIYSAEEMDRLLGREFRPYELAVKRGNVDLSTNELSTSDPSVRFIRVE